MSAPTETESVDPWQPAIEGSPHINEPADMSWLTEPEDTDVIFNNGGVMSARMSILAGASSYFKGNQSFQLTSKIEHITPHDDVFGRVLLFLHTRREEDLAMTYSYSNVMQYLSVAFILDLRSRPNLELAVVRKLRGHGGFIVPMLVDVKRSLVSEDQMLSTFSLMVAMCLRPDQQRCQQTQCVSKAVPWSRCSECNELVDAMKTTLTFPAVWLLAAPQHKLAIDILNLRGRLQLVLKKFEKDMPMILERARDHCRKEFRFLPETIGNELWKRYPGAMQVLFRPLCDEKEETFKTLKFPASYALLQSPPVEFTHRPKDR
ncbi:hypothetical protein HKX48_006983 [Thoreauomyces humboldtii]|nr:hypothetical protein HKX48_006983 [Thoreauomyces humboldtii]